MTESRGKETRPKPEEDTARVLGNTLYKNLTELLQWRLSKPAQFGDLDQQVSGIYRRQESLFLACFAITWYKSAKVKCVTVTNTYIHVHHVYPFYNIGKCGY